MRRVVPLFPPIAVAAVANRSDRHSCDSIGKEMTHFKPIRLMPLSEMHPAADAALKVPVVQYGDAATAIFTPAKRYR